MKEIWLDEFLGRATDGSTKAAIDVGANRGDWTEWMCQHFDTVVAVEPDPRASAVLRAMQKEFPFSLFSEVALSSPQRAGRGVLYMREASLQSSIDEKHPIEADSDFQTHEIMLSTLDSVAAFHLFDEVSLVKVDVEGAEGEVLEGATSDVFRRCKWIIEVHDKAKEVGIQLDRLGYRDVQIMRHPYPDAHPQHYWVYAEPS